MWERLVFRTLNAARRPVPSVSFLIIVLLSQVSTTVSSPANLQSSSGLRRPFTAIWNAPSDNCMAEYGIDLNLSAYGIVNKSAIFYNEAIGLYPSVKEGVITNGGLPQMVNLTSHLEKATVDIIEMIPDVEYDGIAVIDWEYWQPVWKANYAESRLIYRTMSIDLVRSRHPDWNDTLVETVAILEFEQTARALFLSTILLAKQLRPNALWGFYHYPYCFYTFPHEDSCSEIADQTADQMHWLYDRAAVLYPSIYIKDKSARTNDTEGFVKAVTNEAYRVRNNSTNPSSVEVLSYVRYKYTRTDLFLNLEHLRDTVLLSAELGVSGIVIWVSGEETRQQKACEEVQRYIKYALGPLVKTIGDAASRCSLNLCSGHGRCIGNILTCTQTSPSLVHKKKGTGKSALSQESLWYRKFLLREGFGSKASNFVTPVRVENESKSGQTCSCQCYNGWSGESCNMPA